MLHLHHSSFSNPSFASPKPQALYLIHLAELILQPFLHFTYVRTHSPTLPSLYLRHSSFSNPSVASLTSQFSLQPFFRISYVTDRAYSPTFPSLHLRHNSFSKPFHCFTYVTAQSPTLPLLHLRHSSFSNSCFASPTSQAELILQPFRHFTYVTTHSPTLSLLYLRHSSFSNPSVASPTSQFILQPFFASPTSQAELILQPFLHFTYVTTHSPTLPLLYLRHSSFSNRSVASLTSQFILQPFFHLSYVTGFSLTSPGEPPMAFVE